MQKSAFFMQIWLFGIQKMLWFLQKFQCIPNGSGTLFWKPPVQTMMINVSVLQVDLGLGLGLQGLYSAPQTVRITF